MRKEPEGYCEKHHVIPKSIYSQNIAHQLLNKYNIIDISSKENILKLTAKEHFIAHMLLVKIFDNVDKNCYIKMLFAFNIFKNKYKKSKQYSLFRERYSKEMSILLTGKPSRALGKKWSEDSKKKKSENHYMKGKTYIDIYGEEIANQLKNKRSEHKKNRIVTEETKLKIKNRIISEECKRKISESKRGIPLSLERKNEIKKYMRSDENPHLDNTWYKFYHNNGEEIYARKYDMKKIFKCDGIYRLINRKDLICKGWSYKGEFVITPSP